MCPHPILSPAVPPSFTAVWRAVQRGPRGGVASYGDTAEAVFGSRRAARTVGWALVACPPEVPWWRIIRADGCLPGVRDDLQAELLRSEGCVAVPRPRQRSPRARN